MHISLPLVRKQAFSQWALRMSWGLEAKLPG